MSKYPEVSQNPDFPAIEEATLAGWKKENTFQASIDNRANAQEFIFYDGPPFANGLPHYGHLLTGFVKDAYARYQTMRGKKVERRFGWDCHGLPAEMGSEKELGISGRAAISEFGIGKFNEHCRTSVMKYTSEWEYYVNRQARWVDFKNDYKTMDKNFMESVLWAFKQLYDKGLVYEAYRVMPYSWAAETPLSNFETKLDNSYREREDKAITVAFELNTPPAGAPKADKYYVLAWTTTPWTLPSNLALAVGDKVKYVCYVNDKKIGYIMSAASFVKYFINGHLSVSKPQAYITDTTLLGYSVDALLKARLKPAGKKNELTETEYQDFLNSENLKEHLIDYGWHGYHIALELPHELQLLDGSLIGLSYHPLFPYFASHKHSFKILDGSSFVTDGDGTGIVHMAPGFGEEDQKCCEANGIEVVVPVDGQGKFTDAIFDVPYKSSPTGRGLGEGPHPDPLPEGEGVLRLRGLNVIADTCKDEAEPYKEEQLKKFGLANLRIISYLKKTGQLIKEEQIKHNYPHCWRTDMPLIYRAMPSWYVEVTKFRARAVELNKQINWIPEHIRDGQMAHMLATAPDWSISRNRFWGTPIPVWRASSGKIIVIGSIEELEKLSGKKITDLHRPYIDEITITKDGETYTRVEDVFDCWFESGSMPFAQVHYPFENKDWFESHFPADFITEYVGQTRGWFNTLIMLSTAIFDKPPFKNCICHGVVLDSETGMKYSKRLKNYRDPKEVMDTYGADALRWMMLASPVMRGMDLSVDPDGKFIRDVVRLAIKPIWNAYNFFCMYANADGIKASSCGPQSGSTGSNGTKMDPAQSLRASQDDSNVMDRYILAKCAGAVETIRTSLDAYDTPGACEAVLQFFEALNNWYIRRNKERFWKETVDADKQAAYDTLYTVLVTMCKAAAPLLPMTLEEIYTKLTGEASVHLASYPDCHPALVAGSSGEKKETPQQVRGDSELIAQMDWVRDVCNAALAIRNKTNIRVRQPLNRIQIVTANDIDRMLVSIVLDEVNVKAYSLVPSEKIAEYATLKLSINSAILGKRLPEKMKQILPASKKGEWKQVDGVVEIAGEKLLPGEYTLQLEPKPEYADRAQALSTNDALVILDTTITPELEAEGLARDLVRMVQQARKDAGLQVTDRIRLAVVSSGKTAQAAAAHKEYITGQTLAGPLEQAEFTGAAYSAKGTIEGDEVGIFLALAG